MDKQKEKEPWLACCYSIIVPGSGHLYADMYLKGSAFIFLNLLTQIFFIYTLLLDNCPLTVSVLIGIIASLILPIYCCYDSYQNIKKRKEPVDRPGKNIWVALFLSFIFPPLGYAYLKKWIFSLVCFLIFAVTLIFTDFPGNLVLITLICCFHIAFLIFKIANKAKKLFIVLMAFYFVIVFADDLFHSLICEKYLLDVGYVSHGVSMNPVLYAGDRVLIDYYDKKRNTLKVDDIVFILPIMMEDGSETSSLIKRIVAVEGETVQIVDDAVYINGRKTNRLPQYYKGIEGVYGNFDGYEYAVKEPYIVPKNGYFVLGDNLPNSLDSRRFGAVREDQIRAKVTKIFWPPSRMGVMDKFD